MAFWAGVALRQGARLAGPLPRCSGPDTSPSGRKHAAFVVLPSNCKVMFIPRNTCFRQVLRLTFFTTRTTVASLVYHPDKVLILRLSWLTSPNLAYSYSSEVRSSYRVSAVLRDKDPLFSGTVSDYG
ncbi:unnamed protein product [Lasius platythorax]|uniref:Uncharacterized protein n=1 Tax=Lasius platythorax TaxID=488582 RepID=A0AAV2MZH9_9HYME